MSSHALFSFATCALLACGGSWGVQTTTPQVVTTGATIEVDEGYPSDEIELAPQIVYEGRPTFYYENRWYYRDGAHWRYYRNEPNALIEHRRTFETRGYQNRPRDQEHREQPQPQRHDQQRPQEQQRHPQQQHEERAQPQQQQQQHYVQPQQQQHVQQQPQHVQLPQPQPTQQRRQPPPPQQRKKR